MTRRLLAVAAVLTLTALSARAADPARSREAVAVPLEESAGLRALFDLAPGVTETEDGITATAFAIEVIVARIGPDGKLIKACVSSHEEAKKFLAAPIEKVQKAEGHEQ